MGILDKLKDTLTKVNSIANGYSEYDKLIEDTLKEHEQTRDYSWGIKLSDNSVYKDKVAKWPDKEKMDFALYCASKISDYHNNRSSYFSQDATYQNNIVREAYLAQLFRTKLALGDEDVEKLVGAFGKSKKWHWGVVNAWPIAPLLTQVDRQYKGKEVSERMEASLNTLKDQIQKIDDSFYEKQKLKLTERIDTLLFKSQDCKSIKPTCFLGQDGFSEYANTTIQSLLEQERQIWYQLLTKAQKATGSKPSNKYLADTKALFKELGPDKFKRMVNDWFSFLTQLKEKTTEHTSSYGGRTYTYTNSEYLSSVNIEAIKGFIWMCAHFHDNATLQNLAQLAERCYRKIPGKGPAAAAVGNACLFTLYKSKGLDGVGHLSRLKLRIKQSSTQQAIGKYIDAAALEQGVSTHEIEDLAVENFGLAEGARTYQFDDYTCTVRITGVGKSELNWFKPDGMPQKSVPAFVKERHKVKLKKVKDTQKQIDQTTSAQRDRLDRMLRSERKWHFGNFRKLYLEHGLMAYLTKKLIWNFTFDDSVVSAIFLNDQWITKENEVIIPNENVQVSMWHPAVHTVEDIRQWRDFLIENRLQQPLKQAFREVYLLTEAEVRTKTYSYRMAAHVLKQHQFNMLAKTRGWKYSLMGAYDDGRFNEAAELQLPEYGLKAEYWVNELNAEDAFNDTGIWNFITTDQIRFTDTATNQTKDLIDIPSVPFSEVLRDVDLFVGVASVGNDPTWNDSGGVPAYRDYWTSYSFGDLSEVAKNRKEILTGLVPRLKISKVATIQDKFLVVKGKLRTYKIHIGSTNILMEPNDQYLCIVPDRSQKIVTENVFLPFEGDNGLSIILSKAFLLAEDDKITDSTITSQISRK
ncbi:DUF4132 domain-containing protein [uncultured Pontibacter sp.]|uniref:DUF4132 domain-containing protein n=1 Tax=uncultured Pontibacter sp. TaxID=453356 RepID=UPI0026290931|nr:DUF4132 domain-containing protein [uncultured Pontibacter sp.]